MPKSNPPWKKRTSQSAHTAPFVPRAVAAGAARFAHLSGSASLPLLLTPSVCGVLRCREINTSTRAKRIHERMSVTDKKAAPTSRFAATAVSGTRQAEEEEKAGEKGIGGRCAKRKKEPRQRGEGETGKAPPPPPPPSPQHTQTREPMKIYRTMSSAERNEGNRSGYSTHRDNKQR